MRGFLLALQLLTRIPVAVRGEVTGRDCARSAAWFPLVGAVQGLLGAAAALLLVRGFDPLVVGAAWTALLVVTNGGFHLDGLADTFDAAAVKATGDAARDRERRLAVMKQGTIGAAGTVAIVLALLLKALLAGSLLAGRPAGLGAALLFLAPVMAKWAMLPALLAGVPARADGLGRSFIELAGPGTLAAGTAISLALVAAALAAGGVRAPLRAAGATAACCGALAASALLLTRWCRTAFGGITGDSLGAVHEIAETLFLAGASLWTRPSF